MNVSKDDAAPASYGRLPFVLVGAFCVYGLALTIPMTPTVFLGVKDIPLPAQAILVIGWVVVTFFSVFGLAVSVHAIWTNGESA
jgi:hypothetical protein